MKKLMMTSLLALLIAGWNTAGAQRNPDEYLGLPGDNLNLYAVMNLFQESETLEGFERKINEENTRVNNLDLNGDNFVDYIMVQDYVDGNDHTIVLRVALDRNETQDVAVFTVQKFRDGSVQIQLIGDEALYGKNYIVEPIYGDGYGETPNPGYVGNTGNVTVISRPAVHISAWPLIGYLFLPDYIAWRSSWYWGYQPSYWNPWRPYYWHYYYGYHSHWHSHYYSLYRHCDYYRWNHYTDHYYSSIRHHSPQVITRIQEGRYRSTYSRPETRRAGEALYSRVNAGSDRGSRDGNVTYGRDRRSDSQNNSDLKSTGIRTRSEGVSARSSRDGSVKSATVNEGRRTTDRSSSAVQRSSSPTSNRSSSPSVQRSSNASGSRSSSPSVERSSSPTSSRSSSSILKSGSSSSSRSSSPSVERSSSPTSSRSSSPSVQRSSDPSSSRSSATVSRSSTPSSSRSSSPSVQRSSDPSSSRSSSSVLKSGSSSGSRSSSPSVQRSSAPSSSRSSASVGSSSPSSSRSSASVGRSSSSGSSRSSSSGGSSRSSGNSGSSRR